MSQNQGIHNYDVYISFCPADSDWVQTQLLPQLQRAQLRTITEMDFEIGVPRLVNIERAIEASHHTLLVLTPDWIDNEWNEFESLLVGTIDPIGRQQRLIPVMLRPCQPPARIRLLTYADFTQPAKESSQFIRLMQQLQSLPDPSIATVPLPSQFIAGPPIIHPHHFFGRERELLRLFTLFSGDQLQNAAIIGPRRSGKTSLLQYLKHITMAPQSQLRPGQRNNWLSAPEHYQWIFVDFQDSRVGGRARLMHYLLDNLGFPVPSPLDLDRFLEVVSDHLHSPTIMLLDEIDVGLQRYSDLDDVFWESLRSLASHQVNGNLGFVLASHAQPEELVRTLEAHSTSHRGSLFFNIFGYTTTLGPLTELESQELIASSPIKFSEADSNWIIEQSGRWPILLQLLCRERLIALKQGDAINGWKDEGLRQLIPFRHLLDLADPMLVGTAVSDPVLLPLKLHPIHHHQAAESSTATTDDPDTTPSVSQSQAQPQHPQATSGKTVQVPLIMGVSAPDSAEVQDRRDASGSGHASPEVSVQKSALGLILGFSTGILGNLLASWLQQGLLKNEFTLPWVILIGLLTIAGLATGIWLDVRMKALRITMLVCLGSAALVLPFAIASSQITDTPPGNQPTAPTAIINHPPKILRIVASPSTLKVGQTTTLTTVASDEDGDSLIYYWEAEQGAIPTGAQGSTVMYKPSIDGSVSITVTVSDGITTTTNRVRLSVLAAEN